MRRKDIKIIMQHGSIPLILDNAPVLKYVKKNFLSPRSKQQISGQR